MCTIDGCVSLAKVHYDLGNCVSRLIGSYLCRNRSPHGRGQDNSDASCRLEPPFYHHHHKQKLCLIFCEYVITLFRLFHGLLVIYAGCKHARNAVPMSYCTHTYTHTQSTRGMQCPCHTAHTHAHTYTHIHTHTKARKECSAHVKLHIHTYTYTYTHTHT